MTEERKSKTLYANDNGVLRPCIGYECPSTPNYWWVPALGFSGEEGRNLFADKEQARTAIKLYLEREIAKLNEKLEKLKTA